MLDIGGSIVTAKNRKNGLEGKTLERLYAQHRGKVSDKWATYLGEYERIFSEHQNKPVRLLEIGIQNGGSLEIWSRYFPNAEKIVGTDINPKCANLSYADPRIAVVVGDANSDDTQAAILGHTLAFDIIIDDGSHRSSDTVRSFARYFPYLAPGGAYVVEDLHCSYWQEYQGGLYDPFSSITFFKRLVDTINHEHWGIGKPRTDVLRGFFSKYSFNVSEEVLQAVHAIQFVNSLCIVRKESPEHNSLNGRVIAGAVAVVHPELLGLNSTHRASLDQTRNEWTARTLPPDEELPLRINELAKREEWIASLNQSVAERDRHIASLNQSVAERDRHIAGLNQTVTRRDEDIATLHQTIDERDTQVTDLKDRIKELEGAAASREADIATLHQTIDERDTQVTDLKDRIKELEGAAASREAEIADRTKELKQQVGEVKKLRQRVTRLEGQLSAVYASTSWRITRPMRAASHALRVRVFRRNVRSGLKLAWWLGTGQLGRAANCVLPYYHRLVPVRIKALLPDRVRWAVKRRLDSSNISSAAHGYPSSAPAVSGAKADAPTTMRLSRNGKMDYPEWIARNDTLSDDDRRLIRTHIASLRNEPKFSVLMPVYNTPVGFQRAPTPPLKSLPEIGSS
jgi:uncharacterized coiled-coil protein SlyX